MHAAASLDTRAARGRWHYPLLLATLATLAWSNVFSCAFIFDDKAAILDNPRLHRLWPPWEAVSVPTRWLVDLTFAANHRLNGFNPADFHLTNLLIHLAAGLCLYGVIRRTLLTSPVCTRLRPGAAGLAFLVAAAWLVHPLQTESVTYVVQRAEALMGLLMLAVFYAFLRSLTSPRPARWRGAAWALCLLGMGTKEPMVATPFLLILFDATFVADSWRSVARSRGKFHAAMLGTLTGFAVLLACGIARAQDAGGLFYGDSLRWRYLLTQSQAILHYLRLSAMPWPLCLDYRWPLVDTWRDVAWQAPLVAALALAALAGAWRRRAWAFPLVAFFAILAPTSSLMPLPDAVFEHRLYLPLAAVLALTVLGGASLSGRLRPGIGATLRLAGATALVAATGGFTVLTLLRNADYRDEETMWRDVVAKRPDNPRGSVGLASSLLGARRGTEALAVCLAALDRLPRYAEVPTDELRRRWVGKPELPVAEYALLHHNAGAACLALNRNGRAIAHFREAARVLPGHAGIHGSMAQALYAEGRIEEAIAAWRTSLALNPRVARTHTALAVALETRGDARAAVVHYRESLRLDPGATFVRAQLAWLLATHAAVCDGPQAVTLAESLVGLAEGRSAKALDILAAAYAEAGRLPEAVSAAEQAIQLEERQFQAPLPGAADRPPATTRGDAMRQRLECYRSGRSYREPATAEAPASVAPPAPR